MTKCLTKVLLTAVILTTSLAVHKSRGQGSAGQDLPLTIRKCSDFRITGDGSSEQWRKTGWVNLTHQGSDFIDYETKVKVLYSETGIYFLFDCKDEKLTTTLRGDNLNLWEEDVVEVFLWTSEDFPVYFEYELSPMNYELPIIVPNYRGKFLGWLPWKYEGDKKVVHATSVRGGEKAGGAKVEGWMAEFFIPYRLLEPLPEVPPGPGTLWRANMYRIDYDRGASHFSWKSTKGTFHDYNRFGTFIFE